MDEELFDLAVLPPELLSAAWVPAGVPGTGSASAVPYKVSLGFVFLQPAPSAAWTITHNLNRYPQVTVVDTTGRQLEADVTYISVNQVVVSGLVAFAGTAYLV